MTRLFLLRLLALGMTLLPWTPAAADDDHITIAAAADLNGVMGTLVEAYKHDHPDSRIDVAYGSSGNLLTLIEEGAPFDMFFSADSGYPKKLVAEGKASGQPVPYAYGHIVLWSASFDMSEVRVADLLQPSFGRIAIANPQHAPYGKRAEQALRAAGVWDALQPRLVFGNDIAQTAEFAQTGNAQVGIIAESLARAWTGKGSYVLVPPSLYEPLQQSFVLTQRGADNALAQDFATYVQSPDARAIFAKFGFNLPEAEEH